MRKNWGPTNYPRWHDGTGPTRPKMARDPLNLAHSRHYKFRARNNDCGTIAHKIITSVTSLLLYMKDGSKP